MLLPTPRHRRRLLGGRRRVPLSVLALVRRARKRRRGRLRRCPGARRRSCASSHRRPRRPCCPRRRLCRRGHDCGRRRGAGVKAVHPTVAALEVPAIGEATMAVDTWDATVVPDDVCHGRSGAEAGRARPERRLAAEAALVVLSVCEASEVVDAWVCATLVPSVACAGLYVEEAPLGACLQFCCRRRRRDHGSRLRGRGVVVDVGTDRGNASSSKEGAVGEGERDERNNELMPGNGGGPEIARRRAAHREREDHPQGLAR
mmetsp:Transcript_27194/g.78153  ORF Transcript_27194/g.78153 Transcript_27194/m.78153 type:complete len:260 (-) Transcript_27194:54-833(-)